MHDAAKANRQDRAQRKARREKFNGNYSEDTILTGSEREKIEFPEPSSDQIEEERKRIRTLFKYRRLREKLIYSAFLVLSIIAIVIIYQLTNGFENW